MEELKQNKKKLEGNFEKSNVCEFYKQFFLENLKKKKF